MNLLDRPGGVGYGSVGMLVVTTKMIGSGESGMVVSVPAVVFERRFEHWLQIAGMNRAELITALLDIIDEYTEAISRQAGAMPGAAGLRAATAGLVARVPAPRPPPVAPEPIERLTDRERQVLCLIGNGLSNRQIAVTLNISEKTVKNHITSMFAKLGVCARTEALVVAFRNGMLHQKEQRNGGRWV